MLAESCEGPPLAEPSATGPDSSSYDQGVLGRPNTAHRATARSLARPPFGRPHAFEPTLPCPRLGATDSPSPGIAGAPREGMHIVRSCARAARSVALVAAVAACGSSSSEGSAGNPDGEADTSPPLDAVVADTSAWMDGGEQAISDARTETANLDSNVDAPAADGGGVCCPYSTSCSCLGGGGWAPSSGQCQDPTVACAADGPWGFTMDGHGCPVVTTGIPDHCCGCADAGGEHD
jgi:hypothetical protein